MKFWPDDCGLWQFRRLKLLQFSLWDPWTCAPSFTPIPQIFVGIFQLSKVTLMVVDRWTNRRFGQICNITFVLKHSFMLLLDRSDSREMTRSEGKTDAKLHSNQRIMVLTPQPHGCPCLHFPYKLLLWLCEWWLLSLKSKDTGSKLFISTWNLSRGTLGGWI